MGPKTTRYDGHTCRASGGLEADGEPLLPPDRSRSGQHRCPDATVDLDPVATAVGYAYQSI